MLKNSIIRELKLLLRVLPFGLIVFAIYSLIEWFKFSYVLNNQKRFILDTLMVFADSFLINAVCILIVPGLLLSKPSHKNLARVFFTAFGTLPKVIVSYFFLMVLTQFSFEVSQSSPIPALIVLVLFIWAPYFVSMEQFAEQGTQEKPLDEDDINNLDPFDDASYAEAPRTFFSHKQPWRIGFARSLEFTSKNSSLALSIVFVIWLVRVIPELLIGLTMDTNSSYEALLVQSAVTTLGAIIVNIIIFKTLFKGLEPSQRMELLHTFGSEQKEHMNPIIISSPNGARITVLCLLVIFTTAIWSEKRIQVGSFPKDVKLIVNDYQKRANEIVIKFELHDTISKFRWFSPERFRFYEINPLNNSPEEQAKKSPDTQAATSQSQGGEEANGLPQKNDSLKRLMALLKEKLVPPSRSVVYDPEGKVLEDYQYAPRSGLIKTVLVFPVKPEGIKKDQNSKIAKSLYEVSYLNQFGLKQVLLTFSEDSGASLIGKEVPHD